MNNLCSTDCFASSFSFHSLSRFVSYLHKHIFSWFSQFQIVNTRFNDRICLYDFRWEAVQMLLGGLRVAIRPKRRTYAALQETHRRQTVQVSPLRAMFLPIRSSGTPYEATRLVAVHSESQAKNIIVRIVHQAIYLCNGLSIQFGNRVTASTYKTSSGKQENQHLNTNIMNWNGFGSSCCILHWPNLPFHEIELTIPLMSTTSNRRRSKSFPPCLSTRDYIRLNQKYKLPNTHTHTLILLHSHTTHKNPNTSIENNTETPNKTVLSGKLIPHQKHKDITAINETHKRNCRW